MRAAVRDAPYGDGEFASLVKGEVRIPRSGGFILTTPALCATPPGRGIGDEGGWPHRAAVRDAPYGDGFFASLVKGRWHVNLFHMTEGFTPSAKDGNIK